MIKVHNVSDLADLSDYEYYVVVTLTDGRLKTIAKGTIKKHIRKSGWRVLVQRILDESKDIWSE